MRDIIKSFQVLKGSTVIDEFVYSRRGNIYEIYNNSGCLYSGDLYIESNREWEEIIKSGKIMEKFGFVVKCGIKG